MKQCENCHGMDEWKDKNRFNAEFIMFWSIVTVFFFVVCVCLWLIFFVVKN